MKPKLKITLLVLSALLLINSFQFKANDTTINSDPEKDKVLIYILRNILTRSHFVVKDMNDDFSEFVYDGFINGLDPNKRYFTQQDLKEFSKYKYLIDNQLLSEELDFYNLVYNKFSTKIKNAKSYYGDLLAQPFNYKKKKNKSKN